MRKLIAILSALFACWNTQAQEATERPIEAVNQVVELSTGKIHTITLGVGVITSLKFDQNKPIERVMMGSPIATAQVDEPMNRLDLQPAVTSEERTNMIVTLGGEDYNFVLKVSRKLKDVIYTRTFTLESVRAEQYLADINRLANARVLKPHEINATAYIKAIEKARFDPQYRASINDYRNSPLGQIGRWNNCIIHFLEVNSFLDADLLVFKVQFVNTTGFGLFVNARQLELRAGGKPIPIKVSLQDSQDSWVLPGQMETIWLFVQGHKIPAMGNQWTLLMPAEASDVRQVLSKK